jgi:hypothetical protein
MTSEQRIALLQENPGLERIPRIEIKEESKSFQEEEEVLQEDLEESLND